MRKGYVKPKIIKNDMGGEEKPDERMQEIFELLSYIPCISNRGGVKLFLI